MRGRRARPPRWRSMNERLDAELRAKVDELRARASGCSGSGSRSAAGSSATSTTAPSSGSSSMALNIRLARAKLNEDPLAAEQLLDDAGDELDSALDGAARAGARHPPGGAHRPRARHRARDAREPRPGAGRARPSCPDERLPEAVELAAYFVVAEALTNVAKYADGDARDRRRRARERPPGRGGGRRRGRRRRPASAAPACAGSPTGIAVLEGRLEIDSEPGQGNDRQGADPVRVVVADDSVLLREGVVRLLEEKGFEVVGQAGDAEDLIRKVSAHKPDVAVVDIRMPPTNTDDGLRAALEIRAEHPDTGVLVLSQYVEEGYALDLVGDSAGGVGYLLKDRVADVERFVDVGQARGRGRLGARPRGGVAARGPRPPRRPARRAHPARARGARADGRGPLEQRDRRRR